MKNSILTKLLNSGKNLTPAAFLACTLAVSAPAHAQEDTYICNISLPGNPISTVKATSASEAEKKVKAEMAGTAQKIYGITSLNVTCEKK